MIERITERPKNKKFLGNHAASAGHENFVIIYLSHKGQ